MNNNNENFGTLSFAAGGAKCTEIATTLNLSQINPKNNENQRALASNTVSQILGAVANTSSSSISPGSRENF